MQINISILMGNNMDSTVRPFVKFGVDYVNASTDPEFF